MTYPHAQPTHSYVSQWKNQNELGEYAWQQAYLRDLDDLELSVRTSNTLRSYGIFGVYDLVRRKPHELLRLKGLGRKSLTELEEVMEPLGVELGELA